MLRGVGQRSLSDHEESNLMGITHPSPATNSFTYNGLDTRVGKVDSGGTATYRRDGVGVTDSVLNDGSAAYTPGISQRRSGVTTYDLNDRLGTASRQTDTSATTTATRTYDAFGMLLASTGTPKGPFGFAGAHGYQEDGDSGLKLLGHRYYDASTGRFLTRDTAKEGRNWYGYCHSHPLTAVDANGLWDFYRWLVTGNWDADDDSYDAGLGSIWGRDTTDGNGNPVRVGGFPARFNKPGNAETYDGTIHFSDGETFDSYLNHQFWQDHEEGHLKQHFGLQNLPAYAVGNLWSYYGELTGGLPLSKHGPVGHDGNAYEVDADLYAHGKQKRSENK